MAKKDRDLIQEAHDYVASLPDESVDGRLTDDAGEPADIDAWAAQEARQQDTIDLDRPDQDRWAGRPPARVAGGGVGRGYGSRTPTG